MTTAFDAAPPVNQLQRSNAPFRPVPFAPVDICVQERADGTTLLTNRQALKALPVRQVGQYLRGHASERPRHTFLAEPDQDREWLKIQYAQARAQVDSLSQWLIDRGATPDKPVMILSDNSINNALLQLAAMQIGVPAMPVSTAYSLMSKSCSKIGDLATRFQPCVVYASQPDRYSKALTLAQSVCDAILLSDILAPGLVDTSFDQAAQTEAGQAVEERFSQTGLDSPARLLLTSGSTGAPKAVIVTHRNIIASGQLWDQVWPFLETEPLVMVDWLPWNHTAGCHGTFSMALRHGGTLYIDDGKPVPQLIGRTIKRLREVRPNVMVNVPRGLDMLVAQMEADPSIAKDLFANLNVIVYGGAALSPSTLHKLEELSAQATGQRIPISASLGSTETTMPATLIWWPPHELGTLGLPAPGVEAKLVPEGQRYEIRFRGQNITPGYYLDPEGTQAVFDEEGFLKTGDAVNWANPKKPEHGLVYAGRLSENFKLATGTWVSVAEVRSELLEHVRPCISDVVVAAPNQDELGVLMFIDAARTATLFPELKNASEAEMAAHRPLLNHIARLIQNYNADRRASSTRIARAMLLDRSPSIDDSEITDKGHINQRGVLATRAQAVLRLYAAGLEARDCLVFPLHR